MCVGKSRTSLLLIQSFLMYNTTNQIQLDKKLKVFFKKIKLNYIN